MELKCKQQKNEEDITHLVSVTIDHMCSRDTILIYLKDETGISIGFFSKKGFYPMYGTEKKYRVVSVESMSRGLRTQFPTWFKVFRKKEA